MIHLIFDRPTAKLSIYDERGAFWNRFAAQGDAWGNHGTSDDSTPPCPPYGHACWTPQGHFALGAVQVFDEPIDSEGFGQIPVLDLTDLQIEALVENKKATREQDALYNIGGFELPTGRIAVFDRDGLMMHCGGSNAPDPLADFQELCRTYGCTRLYNKDWRDLAAWLKTKQDANTIVYSVVGDPQTLSC